MANLETIRKITIMAEAQGVAQAAAELDRLARAQAGVAVSSDTTAKSSLSAANAYDRLARAIDPVAREQARLERGQTVVNRALSEGAISSDQAARTLGILTERHLAAQRANDNLANSIRASGQATALNRMQMQTMVYTFNDVTASLASGISPMTILMQQGGQVTQAFGGVGATLRAMPAAVAAFVTPTVLGVGSIVGVLGGAAMAAAAYRAEQDKLALSLNGVGRASGMTLESLRETARLGASMHGMTIGDAVGGVSGFAAAGVRGDLMPGLLGDAKKYAKGFGLDLGDALGEVAGAFKDPTKGAESLSERLGFLDGRSRELIRTLQAQGDIFGAQRALADQFAHSVDNLTDRTTRLDKAVAAAKSAFSSGWAAAGQTVDRLIDGPNLAQQLEEADQRLRAAKAGQRGTIFSSQAWIDDDLKKAQADYDRLSAMRDAEKKKAEEAQRQQLQIMLSVKATGAIGGVLPEIGQRRQIIDNQALLGRAVDDPEVLKKTGHSADEARQALANLNGQLSVWTDGAGRLREEGRLQVAGIMARTFAERAAVDMQRAWVNAMRESGDATRAAVAAENERMRLLAEGAKSARDYARSATDDLSLIGLNPREKYKRQLEIEDRKFREQYLPASGSDVKPWEAPFAGGMSRLTSAADKASEALQKMVSATAGVNGATPKTGAAGTTLGAPSPTLPGSNPLTAAPVHAGLQDYVERGSIKGLNATLAERVLPFLNDNPHGLSIISGVRGIEEQTRLWEEALKKYGSEEAARKWVAPPGMSRHGSGNALDLSFEDPDARKWAHENASRYGLRFPMSWEPWHVELAGQRPGQAALPGMTPDALAASAGASRMAGTQARMGIYDAENGSERIRLLNEDLTRNNALLRVNADTFGMSAGAVATATERQRLLNEMNKAGVTITADLDGKISAYARDAGSAAQASQDLADRQRDALNAMDGLRGGARDALGTFVSDLRQGKSAADALTNATNKLLDKFINMGLDMLTNSLFGRSGRMGGGLFGDFFSGMFSGGGGGGGGGMGGMPAMPAMPALPGMGGMGAMPGLSALPGMASMGAMSAMPGMPGMAGMPCMCGMGGMGGMEGLAGMPGMEGLAGMPGMGGMEGLAGMGAMAGGGEMALMEELLPFLMTGLFSQGGSIHAPAEYARVPASIFAGAPRFADGGQIGGGIPIIGHPGEIIMNTMQQRNVADAIKASAAMAGMARTANDNRGGTAVAPVNVVVNNQTGANVKTKETRGPNGQRQIQMMITDAIAHDMDRNGPISQMMKQRSAR